MDLKVVTKAGRGLVTDDVNLSMMSPSGQDGCNDAMQNSGVSRDSLFYLFEDLYDVPFNIIFYYYQD